MELPLIETLREKKNWTDSGFADVQTVLKRIEKCSDFPEHNKNKNKSYDIPLNIKNVLKRFEKEIVRYGFHFEKFRVVVKNDKYEEVKDSLTTTKSTDFCELVVISQDDFQENVELFTGTLKAQGRKLYQSPKSQQQENVSSNVKDYYGTLGSLALLNNEKTVALSCKHVCEKDKYVYIESEQNERISLGKCCYVSPNDPTVQSDLAIVEIDGNMEEYFSVKKLLNHIDKPTNAVVLCLENLDIRGEIVHKLGAVSKWTQGEIVCVEIIKNRQGIIAVRGMNGEEFGKPGDSGSIVFRESTNAKERTLEVVAVLSAGNLTLRKQEDQASGEKKEQESKLVVCSVFKDAFEDIKETNDTIESIAFY